MADDPKEIWVKYVGNEADGPAVNLTVSRIPGMTSVELSAEQVVDLADQLNGLLGRRPGVEYQFAIVAHRSHEAHPAGGWVWSGHDLKEALAELDRWTIGETRGPDPDGYSLVLILEERQF